MGKGKQQSESCQVYEACVIVHGGAWSVPNVFKEASMGGVQLAAKAGYKILLQGGSAVDGVEAAVKSLEDIPVFNAGYGSVMTEDGTVEMDAMIMDGKTLNTGAVACVPNISNPVSLARLVMEKTSHCMLAGEGAIKFASKQGVPILTDPKAQISEFSKLKSSLFGKDTKQDFDSMLVATMNTELLSTDKEQSIRIIKQRLAQEKGHDHDTVGAVAMDSQGNLACATSTGGIVCKMVGRVGDTPICGSGGYANKFAGVSTTGHGESILKVCLARDIASRVENGSPPTQACVDGVKMMYDLTEGQGGVICIDSNGNFGKAFSTKAMSWASLKCGVLNYGIFPGEMEEKKNCFD